MSQGAPRDVVRAGREQHTDARAGRGVARRPQHSSEDAWGPRHRPPYVSPVTPVVETGQSTLGRRREACPAARSERKTTHYTHRATLLVFATRGARACAWERANGGAPRQAPGRGHECLRRFSQSPTEGGVATVAEPAPRVAALALGGTGPKFEPTRETIPTGVWRKGRGVFKVVPPGVRVRYAWRGRGFGR